MCKPRFVNGSLATVSANMHNHTQSYIHRNTGKPTNNITIEWTIMPLSEKEVYEMNSGALETMEKMM